MNYPNISPVAVQIGPISVYWYGLMYVLGFVCFVLLGQWRIHNHKHSNWTGQDVTDLLVYITIGVVVGGRIGYMLFYNLEKFVGDPVYLIRVWEGGMSFHGGMIGVVIAAYLFGKKSKRRFLEISDFVAPLTPIGLGLGRIGNFINAELPGRITNSPLGLYFPGEHVLRHPSSVYQAITEGLILFVLVWMFARKSRQIGHVSGLFLLGYGSIRFLTEFFREPDAHIGFLWVGLSTGQMLSVPMILLGIYLFTKKIKATL